MMLRLKKNPTPTNIFDGVIATGSVLVVITNPTAPPAQWKSTEHLLANAGKPSINYGLRIWEERRYPGYLLLLGSEEKGGGITRISLHRLRWDGTSIVAKQTLQPDGNWSEQLEAKRRILFEGASQSSVHYDRVKQRYIALYARGWEGIWLRTSKQLEQGWSTETKIFRYPELQRYNKDVFCGTLGVHLQVGSSTTANPLLSYMCNSTNFWAMAKDIALYVPKFVQVNIK